MTKRVKESQRRSGRVTEGQSGRMMICYGASLSLEREDQKG